MKKLLIILMCIFFMPFLVSCDELSGSMKNGKFQVIFFDIENTVLEDGQVKHFYGTENNEPYPTRSVKPADCYMIKAGNTEILVDAGFQYNPDGLIVRQRIAKIYQENVIKKLEKYCTDGVLDYLIVTHGDYDHIIGLSVDGGVLDYFYNDENKRIDTIIDFDSDLVTYLSDEKGNNIYPSGYNNFFSDTALKSTINPYREKRDKLVNTKETKHIPAAAFFKGTEFLKDNVMSNAMSDEMLKKYFLQDKAGNLTQDIDLSSISNFYYFSDNIIYHNCCDPTTQQPKPDNLEFESKYKNLDLSFGSLKKEDERYYYSIPLENGTELRILYNWFYDHFMRFNRTVDFDSEEHNNISVCFSVVSGEKSFVSFGDLGTGESGIIRYYKDTSILKKVSCFKASHHGSTGTSKQSRPRENTEALFKLMTPEIVVVPGVAQINRDILTKANMQSDPIYSSLSGVAVMKEAFFNNIKAGSPNTKIYCTQIAKLINVDGVSSLISAPLYGDIIISVTAYNVKMDCTLKGEIEGYVSSYSDNLKHYKFYNQEKGKILSYDKTEYWRRIYEDYGKEKENLE